MLLERYDFSEEGLAVKDDEPLLGDRIDSRRAYFTKLNRSSVEGVTKNNYGGIHKRGNSFAGRGFSQRVVVKAHFKRHNSGSAGAGNLRGHLGYITRAGAGVDDDRPELFGSFDGADSDLSRSDFYNLCKEDRHHFRVIISPENGHELEDFGGYIGKVMEKVEGDLGTKLEWVSAVHYDTDHVHAHVVIRGKDDKGKDLVIAPDYISNGIRGRAQEVITKELGERSLEDIQREMEKETTALRVTSLDRFIESRGEVVETEAGGVSEIKIKSRDLGRDFRDAFKAGLVSRRLAFLATTSMARQEAHGVYYVRSDFMVELRGISEKHDVIKQLHRSMPDEALDNGVSLYKIGEGANASIVRGEIEKIAHVNELTDNKYMVIRDEAEQLHHVSLALNNRNESLREGMVVEVSAGEKSSMKADRNILAVAGGNDGIYSRELHLAHVAEHMSFIKEPEGYVDYHVKRAGDLEKASIIEAQFDEGLYKVPQDIVERGEILSIEQDAKYKRKQYAHVKSLSVVPIKDKGFVIYDLSDADAPSIAGRVEQAGNVSVKSDKRYMLVRDSNEVAHYVALSKNKDIALGAIVEVSVGEYKSRNFAKVKTISPMPIDKQIDAHARTFLDLEIYRHQNGHDLAYENADKGTLEAIHKRMSWLSDNGYAYHKEDTGEFIMKGDALGKLEKAEMEATKVRMVKGLKAMGCRDINFTKGQQKTMHFLGYVDLHSGHHIVTENKGFITIIKSKSDTKKWIMNEPLKLEQGENGIDISRMIMDKSKEDALKSFAKRFDMSFKDIDVSSEVNVSYVGSVHLTDGVYAAVSHNDDLSLVKTKTYETYEYGQELELINGMGGYVDIKESDAQQELELEAIKELEKDKDIEIDW